MSFEGKVAWITGASSGIGAALCRALANRGASLVLSARREKLLQDVQMSCSNTSAHCVLPLDLLEEEAVRKAPQQVIERLGRVDFLFHNAGLSQRALAMETELEVDRRIMRVNFFGAVALTKAVLPSMIAQGAGHIVIVSSLLGKFGLAERSAYAASKHALHGFFDSLRMEVDDAGIHITLVCPGFVRTESSINALTGNGRTHGTMDESLQRGLSPETCADRILRAVQQGKHELYVGGKERFAVYLSRYCPRIFFRAARKTRLK